GAAARGPGRRAARGPVAAPPPPAARGPAAGRGPARGGPPHGRGGRGRVGEWVQVEDRGHEGVGRSAAPPLRPLATGPPPRPPSAGGPRAHSAAGGCDNRVHGNPCPVTTCNPCPFTEHWQAVLSGGRSHGLRASRGTDVPGPVLEPGGRPE